MKKTQVTGIVIENSAKNSLDMGKMLAKDAGSTVIPILDTVGMGVVDIAIETAKGFGVGCLKAGARATINFGTVKDAYAKNLAEFKTAKEERTQVLNEARNIVQQRQLEKELDNPKVNPDQGEQATSLTGQTVLA